MSVAVDWNVRLSEALQAIADNPGDRRAHLQRVQSTLALGKPALARRFLEAYLRSAPDDPRALDLHAAACLTLGEAERAAESAALALDADPDYCPARYNLACALARLGRRDVAIDALILAVIADPDLRAMAVEDQDFVALRDEPRFRALIAEAVSADGLALVDDGAHESRNEVPARTAEPREGASGSSAADGG